MTAKNNSAANITELLRDWGEGNMQAMDKLLPLVYDDLRRSATLICAVSGLTTRFNQPL